MSKNYNDHKETISKFKRVIVTGPHGAGNKITAKIISHDINAPYIRVEMPWSSKQYWDESLGLKKRLEEIRDEHESFVLFTPSTSGHLHRILDYLQDTLVVFTYKDPSEIDEYTQRNDYLINNTHNYESIVYTDVIVNDFPHQIDLLSDTIENMTWKLWEEDQRQMVPHWIDVHHSSLEGHELFIPRDQRTGFKAWQTSLDQRGHN